nr:RING-H2 finger protein ATL66-like [Nicotiana tomentosiformis]
MSSNNLASDSSSLNSPQSGMSSQNSHSFHWHYAEFDDNDFQIRGRTLFFVVVLFAIILIATLLFLYARWVCKFRSPLSAEAARSAHAPSSVPPPPQGLDPAFIDNLPIILHRTSDCRGNTAAEVECCICLGIFQDGDKVKVLPSCQHCYHSECVDKWLRNQSSCPLCRASLQFNSAV